MGMNAASNRLYHLGVKPVPRSIFLGHLADFFNTLLKAAIP
jgi:hypothetical protein